MRGSQVGWAGIGRMGKLTRIARIEEKLYCTYLVQSFMFIEWNLEWTLPVDKFTGS